MKDYRIGLGLDIHRFSRKKKPLILGGFKISDNGGLVAVSDGDVVLHAIADALCGACCLGDIGDYFPPSSKKSKNIKSTVIVKTILDKIKKKFTIVNIDITIVADKPRLFSYKKDIVLALKKVFSVSQINVKIKSKEGGSFLGSKNSISCLAAALVKKR
jgi:2-C-methyl-D-erythritol 4-phosphate cytidylyltransferase/2-C-methyl-D-erythritol 2,4-cyclodiphosphate synthase